MIFQNNTHYEALHVDWVDLVDLCLVLTLSCLESEWCFDVVSNTLLYQFHSQSLHDCERASIIKSYYPMLARIFLHVRTFHRLHRHSQHKLRLQRSKHLTRPSSNTCICWVTRPWKTAKYERKCFTIKLRFSQRRNFKSPMSFHVVVHCSLFSSLPIHFLLFSHNVTWRRMKIRGGNNIHVETS